MPTSAGISPELVLLGALLAAALAGAIALWILVVRLARFEAGLAQLEHLAALRTNLERLSATHADLDLRRLEHALLDVRDTQRRTADLLLAASERAERQTLGSSASLAPIAAPSAGALVERVVTRLLALGYERVVLVTPQAALDALLTGEGHVQVEARRDGAACKGRVLVRAGAIGDVQIQSAYSTFP